MESFRIDKIVLDDIKSLEDLKKFNKSECDDILSQIIFNKIDRYAFSMSVYLHNAIFDDREILPYLFLCLEEEISTSYSPSAEYTLKLFDNTTKLFTAPNLEFKEIVTMKTFPKIVIINGYKKKVHFNPYLIALHISEIYYRLFHDKRIKDWCDQGYIKFESIEKVIQIIEDKYSYRFVDLTQIAFKILSSYSKIQGKDVFDAYDSFLGAKGSKIVSYYLSGMMTFYNDELLKSITGLFGHLNYS